MEMKVERYSPSYINMLVLNAAIFLILLIFVLLFCNMFYCNCKGGEICCL